MISPRQLRWQRWVGMGLAIAGALLNSMALHTGGWVQFGALIGGLVLVSAGTGMRWEARGYDHGLHVGCRLGWDFGLREAQSVVRAHPRRDRPPP